MIIWLYVIFTNKGDFVINMSTTKTSDIKAEFMSLLADDTTYTLQEMKTILGDVFKTRGKSNHKSNKDSTKKAVKKAPNAYNMYVKEKMPEFKKDHPDTPITGLMSLIGADWKNLSPEEKDSYKVNMVKDAIRDSE